VRRELNRAPALLGAPGRIEAVSGRCRGARAPAALPVAGIPAPECLAYARDDCV